MDQSAAKEENKENKGNGPKILMTGFVQSEMDELMKKITELDGQNITSFKANLATHVIMPKLGRTVSLLCAMPYVKFVLSADWVRKSKEEGKWIGKEFLKKS